MSKDPQVRAEVIQFYVWTQKQCMHLVAYAMEQGGTWEANTEPRPPVDIGRTAAPAGCHGTEPALHTIKGGTWAGFLFCLV